MYATDVIEQALDPEALLLHYGFNKINRHGNYIRACCKLHDGNNPTTFVYNVEENTWYCHKGCGGGDVYELIQKLENCTFAESIKILARFLKLDISDMELAHIKTKNEKEREVWVKLMKEKPMQITQFNYTSSEEKPIKKFRHFKQETLKHFGAVYVEEFNAYNTENKPYLLTKRILIPVYYNGIRIGVSLRRVVNSDIQKWSHQGFESKYVLYNFDECIKYIEENDINEIILVEGIFDVWNCYEQGIYNVVATFGAHLTKEQEKLLLRFCTTITTAYDGDLAGINCTKKIIEQCKYKFDIYCIVFDGEQDPGNCMEMQNKLVNKINYTKFGGRVCKI